MQDRTEDADGVLVEQHACRGGVESPEHRPVGAPHFAVGRNRAAAASDLGKPRALRARASRLAQGAAQSQARRVTPAPLEAADVPPCAFQRECRGKPSNARANDQDDRHSSESVQSDEPQRHRGTEVKVVFSVSLRLSVARCAYTSVAPAKSKRIAAEYRRPAL